MATSPQLMSSPHISSRRMGVVGCVALLACLSEAASDPAVPPAVAARCQEDALEILERAFEHRVPQAFALLCNELTLMVKRSQVRITAMECHENALRHIQQ